MNSLMRMITHYGDSCRVPWYVVKLGFEDSLEQDKSAATHTK